MTIKDIVQLSGYSLGTVSRVINGHPNVSEKARNHILSIMQEYDFHPNENAKLMRRRASFYALIVRGNSNMLFADIIEQIQHMLYELGEEPAVVNYIDEYDNEVTSAIAFCKTRRPKGLIFLGGNLDHFEESFKKIKLPSVILTNSADSLSFPNLSSFTTDDLDATEHVIQHFVDQGHKNIAVVGGNLSSSQISFRRLQGCLRCLKANNIPFDLDLQHQPCRYSFEESYQATRTLLDRYPQATAIFALSDVTAIAAMRAINDMGLSVPRDISVIGYDGITLSRYSCPRLTTIYQNRSLIARKGIEELIRMEKYMAEGQDYTPVHEVLPYEFLKGESVQKID